MGTRPECYENDCFFCITGRCHHAVAHGKAVGDKCEYKIGASRTKKVIVFIDEEYGYRHWIWEGTQEEYAEIVYKWKTMKGLNCLVPVWFVFPGAKEVFEARVPKCAIYCHMHESDDSWIEGVEYEIPESHSFFMDGTEILDEDLMIMKHRKWSIT